MFFKLIKEALIDDNIKFTLSGEARETLLVAGQEPSWIYSYSLFDFIIEGAPVNIDTYESALDVADRVRASLAPYNPRVTWLNFSSKFIPGNYRIQVKIEKSPNEQEGSASTINSSERK